MTQLGTPSTGTSSSSETSEKPVSRIGGSILPSSEPRILLPMNGPHGTFQVRPLRELDTYGLYWNQSLIAMHPNGYSCHSLAERILRVWEGTREEAYAMEQFDYILACGGLGTNRGFIQRLVQGFPGE